MSLRRMLPFILINVVVSAVVVLAVLYWWDSRQENAAAEGTPPAGQALVGTLTPAGTVQPSGVTEQGEAQASPETTPEEASGEALPVHVVQAGETLGTIAQRYDVPVEDIATANEIANVNSIAVGQQLLIPVGGLPTETPRPPETSTPAATPTTLPTEPAAEGSAVVEIAEVIGVGDLTGEAVRISNSGTRPLALRGWQLEDEQGHVYTFVDVTLYGSSEAGTPSILIHTEAGQNGPSDLYWGQEVAVWESGETVTLLDAEGTVQATYDIP